MPDLEQWDREKYSEYLKERGFTVTEHVDAILFFDRVIERADVVLVYENSDLGHPELGSPKIVSYGSEGSFLTEAQFPAPPAILPDTPKDINWRYTLKARVS